MNYLLKDGKKYQTFIIAKNNNQTHKALCTIRFCQIFFSSGQTLSTSQHKQKIEPFF